MKHFFLFALVLVLFGCDGAVVAEKPPAPTPPAPIASNTPQARIDALEALVAKATLEKNEVARLTALKDLISEKLRQGETEVASLKLEKQEADKALDEARTCALQAKLWWFVGIMGLIALGAAALAFFVPSVTRWAVKLAIAAAAVAALAAFFSWMLPWLFWIGAVIALIGAIAALLYWRMDNKSRDQVLNAVDTFKDRMPGYKEHFAKIIDSDADKAIDKARVRLGLKK